MAADPGWLAAVPHVGTAVISRRRLLAVRPAINAARASVLGAVLTAVMLFIALTVFGAPAESDYVLTGAIVGGTVALVAVAIFRLRTSQFTPPHLETDPATQFLATASLMTALATVPVLSSFVCFFLGGGYLIYGLGAVSALGLLLGPARPTQRMAADLGARLDPPVSADQMWEALTED